MYGNACVGSADVAVPSGPIPSAGNDAFSALDSLGIRIASLEDRLVSVMTPEPPQKEGAVSGGTISAPASLVAERFGNIADIARRFDQRISILLSRLEV